MSANYFIIFYYLFSIPFPPSRWYFYHLMSLGCSHGRRLTAIFISHSFSHLLLNIVQRLSLKLGLKSLTPIAHADIVPVRCPLIMRNLCHEILIWDGTGVGEPLGGREELEEKVLAELGNSPSLDDVTTQIKTQASSSCIEISKIIQRCCGKFLNCLYPCKKFWYNYSNELSYNDQINDIKAQVAIRFLISRLHHS